MSVIKIKDKPSINDTLEFIGGLYPKYWFEDEYNLEKKNLNKNGTNGSAYQKNRIFINKKLYLVNYKLNMVPIV